MTREVAIKAIQDFIGWFKEDSLIRKALEMAIQALSQEPCDDAISREYLFKVLDDFCGHDRTATITLDTLADIVYELPSVTHKSETVTEFADRCRECGAKYGKLLKQKSGKWRRVSIEKYIQHAMAYYVCSECGGQTIGEPKYCPNCGAKMESEDEE